MLQETVVVDGVGDYAFLHDDCKEDTVDGTLLLLGSFLQDAGVRVHFLDARDPDFSHQSLLAHSTGAKVSCVFVKATHDNLPSLERLDIPSRLPNVTVILICAERLTREDESLCHDRGYYLAYVDLSSDQSDPLRALLSHIPASSNKEALSKRYATWPQFCHWGLIRRLENRLITIESTVGCPEHCSFCAWAGTRAKSRPVKVLTEEIRCLTARGVRYVHLASHGFASERSYVVDFCASLMDLKLSDSVVWSLYLTPERLMELTDLLPMMAASGLRKIELSVESGSDEILRKLSLPKRPRYVRDAVEAAVQSGIPCIQGHLLVGTPGESQTTAEETAQMAAELIGATPGVVEFAIHAYHSENGYALTSHLSTGDGQSPANRPQGFDRPGDWPSSRHREVTALRQKIRSSVEHAMAESVKSMSAMQRLQHHELGSKGLKTRYFEWYLKGNGSERLFELKSCNPLLRSSWEISEPLDCWKPVFVGWIPDKDDLADLSLPVEGTLTGKSNRIRLTELQTLVLHLIKKGLSVGQIVNKLSSRNSKEQLQDGTVGMWSEIRHFLNILESYHLVAYSKVPVVDQAALELRR